LGPPTAVIAPIKIKKKKTFKAVRGYKGGWGPATAVVAL